MVSLKKTDLSQNFSRSHKLLDGPETELENASKQGAQFLKFLKNALVHEQSVELQTRIRVIR